MTRIDIRCAELGLKGPECRVHLQFVAFHQYWVVVALATPDKVGQVAKWLEEEFHANVRLGTGLAPKMARAEIDELPPAWMRLVSGLKLQYMDISPGGLASMFVDGSNETVRNFLNSAFPGDAVFRMRPVEDLPTRASLTPRQHEALATAVAMGYYSTPHAVELRALAFEMDISLGSVSELLRRGEGTVVTGYVDSMSKGRADSLAPIRDEEMKARPRDRAGELSPSPRPHLPVPHAA